MSEYSRSYRFVKYFHPKPTYWFLSGLLLCGLVLPACTDGLVLDPVPEFSETQLILPKQTPSPEPAPKTRLEKASRRLKSTREHITPYMGTLLLALILLVGVFRFLRLIYVLSTTDPD